MDSAALLSLEGFFLRVSNCNKIHARNLFAKILLRRGRGREVGRRGDAGIVHMPPPIKTGPEYPGAEVGRVLMAGMLVVGWSLPRTTSLLEQQRQQPRELAGPRLDHSQ